MHLNKQLLEKTKEALLCVLPITAIVLLLSITIAPLEAGILVLFLFGALLLVVGMGFFTLGVDMSMIPMGEGIGQKMSRAKHIAGAIVIFFLLGLLTTLAEPDLAVLATQLPGVPDEVIMLTVAVGVGLFLVLAALRIQKRLPLPYILVGLYILVFILAFFIPDSFIPVSFDAGGVTTGPVTVPFIMALGIGIASGKTDKNSGSDSFGLISLCSIGPILSVMILGICYNPSDISYAAAPLPAISTTQDVALYFLNAFPDYLKEVTTALAPIALCFLIFQLFTHRFRTRQLMRIAAGVVYTYIGLVLFLTGVSVGFMPSGQYIGGSIASGSHPWLLLPLGMLIGYFLVKAEPAVAILTKQVEEVSNGSISQHSIRISLSVGVSASVGIAMLRILTGVNILWFLIPGYTISLIMTFFVPAIFTGVAFDSGGVASGPMTTTFLLPFSMGACRALGGDLMADAFGIVAMVAMTPLLTIQVLGLTARVRHLAARKRLKLRVENVEDTIFYYDSEQEVSG